jgi:hypothetical protein
MKIYKLSFVNLFSLVLILPLASQSNQSKLNSISENGYCISFPSDWEINKSGQMGTSFILLSPIANPNDKFRENVNLIIQDLSGQHIDLTKYTDISIQQIKTLATNGVLIDSKRIKRSNFEYQKVLYTIKQGIYDLKIEQYYFINSGKAYVLTLTCEISEFEKYRLFGEEILNSFQITDK